MPREYTRRPLADRFWAKVRKTDGCWVWTAALRNGYGVLGSGEHAGTLYAHRVAYAIQVGPLPAGLFVCHRCDNRACVRGDHLFAGDHAANVADMMSKGRFRLGARPDRRGTKHPMARLTPADVVEIRRLRAAGEKLDRIAARFGVSASLVSKIARRVLWDHI